MNIFIFDQYSEICEGEDFHTGKTTTVHKPLSALEYSKAIGVSHEQAKQIVTQVISDTENMGNNFSIVMQSDCYAEMKVYLQEDIKLYRVIYTKS